MLFTPDKVTRGFYASHAWELIMLGIWSVGIPGFLGILHITQRCVTYFYIEFNSLLWELLPIYKSLAGYLEKRRVLYECLLNGIKSTFWENKFGPCSVALPHPCVPSLVLCMRDECFPVLDFTEKF